MKNLFAWLFFLAVWLPNFAMGQQQLAGCMDPLASNYNSAATISDGSCTYSGTQYQPFGRVVLPPVLEEISGACFWDGKLWVINDGGNEAALYAVDTTAGKILNTILLQNIANNDWEALAQNDTAFFIADVGNNAAGNRTNLVIYILPKQFIDGGQMQALDGESLEKIQYSYSDQTDFSPQGGNNTRFDCESVIFFRDSLHLFTKNWVGNYAVHYRLPARNGTHTAERIDSIFTGNQLLTDATVAAFDKIVFTSYSRGGQCALLMAFGFGGNENWLQAANKRWVGLPNSPAIGQLEAICFRDAVNGWIGSERLSVAVINVSQRIYRVSTLDFIAPFYKAQQNTFAEPGMLRYNTELEVYEAFDGAAWKPLHN